ncbi:Hint domain-containing protein [Celeribacter indicus]|uniref:Hedgehog/Intein (Hint) domain-containing protein n=1 Tax=Celeribacter indicus TaxID=1208324 RepID=A0A0B5E4Q6_9RHOB|nr:Hint domain-containing protein [Celeribacter indicus]AJE48335.1 hypothetical protein P73_3620 [Celeribacter indicus]
MSQPLSRARPVASRTAFGSPELPVRRVDPPSHSAWTVRRTSFPERTPLPLRRYDILWRDARGGIRDAQLNAPALPLFESAFTAFARGALLPTRQGAVAIEDLLPGDEVETTEGDFVPVDWLGSVALDTQGRRAPGAHPEPLYRITADAFGLGRPTPDLVLGPAARLLIRHAASRALAPIRGLVDGVSVVEMRPPAAVRCYHLRLTRHAAIRVNGLELESFHPGPTANTELSGELRAKFLTLFPHLGTLAEFGRPCHPRLTPAERLARAS